MDERFAQPGDMKPPLYSAYPPPNEMPPSYQPPAPPPGVYPPAVVSQPGLGPAPINTTTRYMIAENVMGVPLGYLAAVDQLIIKQEIHLEDVVSNIATDVKFDILNTRSELVFRAEEQNEFCNRQCCRSNRSFNMFIKNAVSGQNLIAIRRPFRCCGCCLPCWCLQELHVETPPGFSIGVVKQNWTLCSPSFTVYDDQGDILFDITGPCCPSNKTANIGVDVNFEVIDHASSQMIGVISKHWAGLLQEACTNASNFSVSFPLHLSVQHKAILLSVSFLLNFMFFETVPIQHRQRHTAGSARIH